MLDYFFFNDTATTEIYTLSLHDALPIFLHFLGGLKILHQKSLKILKFGAFFLKNRPWQMLAVPKVIEVDRICKLWGGNSLRKTNIEASNYSKLAKIDL